MHKHGVWDVCIELYYILQGNACDSRFLKNIYFRTFINTTQNTKYIRGIVVEGEKRNEENSGKYFNDIPSKSAE